LRSDAHRGDHDETVHGRDSSEDRAESEP
jgi:hypothetical protein